MKRGIFGGTFNPVHYGHLRAADETREAFGLDRVVFIPCRLPPHKDGRGVATPEARVRMLELAIRDNPCFEISDMELKRGGKSYSIETLRELKNIYGDSEEIFFIIGMDSFVEIGIWKNYQDLFALTDFVVAARPGYMDQFKDISPLTLLPVDIRDDFCYDSQSKKLRHKSGKTTHFFETTLMDISSTRIRRDISEGRSVRYLMPREVERFIMEKGLY